MGDCHVNYSSPKCEEKYCKYSYTSWCPTCERHSPRRRSRSETQHVECRRKGKEMKNASPRKYTRSSQEYENMDLEEHWPPSPKDSYRQSHFRSSQLCELPTSYITNNCQTSKPPLPTAEYGTTVKQTNFDSKNMNKEDLIEVLKYEKNKHFNNLATKPLKPPSQHLPLYFDNHLSFDTTTYFDKYRYSSNLQDRYSRELESIREKINAWKSSNGLKHFPTTPPPPTLYADRLQERYVKEIDAMKIKLEEYKNTYHRSELITIQQQEILPRPNKPRISLKTKTSRLNSNSAKLKKKPSLPKVASNVQVVSPESDCSSDSDLGSDDEEQINSENNENESESISDTTCNGAETSHIPHPEGGDVSGWPIRSSLFPHIPPYVKFNTHDAPHPVKLPAGRKLFKWKLSTITPIVVRKTLTNSGFVLVRKSNQWMGTWGKHMKSPMFKTLKDTQKLNHFPGTFQLGRKDRLWKNFQRHINKYGYKEFGFIPQTFVLPQELKILKQNWEYKSGVGGEAWIIKPPASARGVGIKVINKWSHLPKKQSLVVQKYISNPYLINGSKFDLRLYVLVTSFHPLRIYLYPEGLARFASAKYSDDVRDLKDRYVHLTNYSINKLSSQYTANEDANACQGHKWTLTKLFEYMSKDGVDTKALWRNLQQLVIKTIITGEAPITNLCEENMLSRYNCYELFGVDVLLDEHLKAWLLEVNISPSLHSASPLDAHVKGPMVQMLFDLAQFHFPPKLAQLTRQASVAPPACYEHKLYTQTLTRKEREKHALFEQFESRDDYLEDILENLTGDDVRRLVQAEDEFTVKGRFERIFPTGSTHKYLDFMEARYYNRLFDAWEVRYEKSRQEGVDVLKSLCERKVHLKVAPQTALNKNSQSTIPGAASLQPSKEGQSRPLAAFMQEITIGNNPSCN